MSYPKQIEIGGSQPIATTAGKPDIAVPSTSAPAGPCDQPATSSGTGRQAYEVLRLVVLSAAWLASSSGVILANRYIMVELKWPYAFAVSAMGMGVSGLFGFIVCDVMKLVPPVDITFRFYMQRVFPIGAFQALVMWLSNSLYLLLTVAFIEMSRALLPLFIMAALYLAGLETPTRPILMAVSLTGLGGVMAAHGEIKLTVMGLVFLLLNSCFEAGRLVLMQVLLVGHEFHAFQGLKLISPASFVCLVVMSVLTEFREMRENDALGIMLRHWPMFLLAACMGLCVNLASNIVIKTSGSTALKVLAAMRGPLVIMSGIFFFAEHVAPLQFVGYSIALAGFVWYNIAKSQQQAQAKASPPGQAGTHQTKEPEEEPLLMRDKQPAQAV